MSATQREVLEIRRALTPVRAAVQSAAQREAERVRARGSAEAAALLAGAHSEVVSLLARARQQGERDGEALAEADRGGFHRQARGIVLSAQRAAYEELRCRAATLARRLASESVYLQWREGVAGRARTELGAQCLIESGDDAVSAEFDGRRLEWSLDALADRAVEHLGPRCEALWTP